MANYQLKDHRDLVFSQLDSNIGQTMDRLAEVLVEAVQKQMLYGYHTPHGADGHTEILDTGELFDSIAADWEKQSQNLCSLNVGVPTGTVPADYADFVHNGTNKLEPRPFITDGVMNAQEDIKKVCADNLPIGFDK